MISDAPLLSHFFWLPRSGTAGHAAYIVSMIHIPYVPVYYYRCSGWIASAVPSRMHAKMTASIQVAGWVPWLAVFKLELLVSSLQTVDRTRL